MRWLPDVVIDLDGPLAQVGKWTPRALSPCCRLVSMMTTCHLIAILSTVTSSQRADRYRALLAEVYELAGRSRRQSDVEAAAYGSTGARWLAMSAISDRDLTVASIARRLGLPRQAVHRVVDDLVAQGHVEKLPNADHARSELVSLTAEGRSVLRKMRRASDRHRSDLLDAASVSDEEIEMARDVLSRILTAFRGSAD
jgi:DNA-binding MarR family transcriptional regulator